MLSLSMIILNNRATVEGAPYWARAWENDFMSDAVRVEQRAARMDCTCAKRKQNYESESHPSIIIQAKDLQYAKAAP